LVAVVDKMEMALTAVDKVAACMAVLVVAVTVQVAGMVITPLMERFA
jgi:hypothetical protein